MAISFVLYAQTKKKINMPPPPNYPKGDISIINPIDITLSIRVQQDTGKVSISHWK